MISDKFTPLPIDRLLRMALNQYDQTGFIFGIPKELFFRPSPEDSFRMQRFGQLLETPVGVAAGPHTQLAQNIVAAWLTGARFIELKTIQTLDELEISKPCIDMQDEGYNCEWSQELKINQSFEQYLDAWILIHILKDKLKIGSPDSPGFIFNMSVGYNLEGILNENVQWFLDKMNDASGDLERKILAIKNIYPRIENLKIGSQLSDNVTLSTMHGCPPDEIGKIGEYLIGERQLHTAVKLNPTLIGKAAVQEVFKASGFDTVIPDVAFDHDLKYDDVLTIISNLSELAHRKKLQFSLKLTNTLESRNHKTLFDSSQEMMYMSGRSLHPLSVKLAAKLQNEYSGKLDISFSGGADAFNILDLIKSGLAPVTVCTDLLKPGGYGRLNQYIENLRNEEVSTTGNHHLDHLKQYAADVSKNQDYRRTYLKAPSVKTGKPLSHFDCIHAPCETTCPTNQDIPSYLYHMANGDPEAAARVVTETNPFPQATGMVCDHLCQTKCTRINYDSPLLIREVKRVIAEHAPKSSLQGHAGENKNRQFKAAIIGAGPSGLSCAYFLCKAGMEVEIFETKPQPGGMVAGAIPAFRLPDEKFNIDVQRITAMGVSIHYNRTIDRAFFEKLRSYSDFVYIAAGAQISKPLEIEGIHFEGVLDPLQFLFDVKSGNHDFKGKNVIIVGGGNTAMDAARTAWRLVGDNGKVTIAYRRSIQDMPADLGEIRAVMEEGVEIVELVAPVRIKSENGKVASLTCRKMKPGAKDASGRSRPVEIPGSDFDMPADAIIPAIGQELAIDLPEAALRPDNKENYETGLPGVFIGGDAMRGASTAINAIGDGRKAAQEIIDKACVDFRTKTKTERPSKSYRQHFIDKARRIKPVVVEEIPVSGRKNFNLVQTPLSLKDGIEEAGRCLRCDEMCSVCTTVCPNLALFTYRVEPFKINLQKIIQKNGQTELIPDGDFEISQPYQILHLADWCNRCGNCSTFCPTAGAPYLDKPHLFFDEETFRQETEGFYKSDDTLLGKVDGEHVKFEKTENGYIFTTEKASMELDENLQIKTYEVLSRDDFEINLKTAAVMKLVFSGAESL